MAPGHVIRVAGHVTITKVICFVTIVAACAVAQVTNGICIRETIGSCTAAWDDILDGVWKAHTHSSFVLISITVIGLAAKNSNT